MKNNKVNMETMKSYPKDNLPKIIKIWHSKVDDAWDYLKYNDTLKSIAKINRGIEWNIELKSNRTLLISEHPKQNFSKGLDTASGKIEPFITKNHVYLNLNNNIQRTNAFSLNWNAPKVIINAVRMSRGPWRIFAATDDSGLVLYQNFHAAWPKNNVQIEVIAALVNSPIINAYMHSANLGKHNNITTLYNAPIPSLENIDEELISSLVKKYTQLRIKYNKTMENRNEIADILLKIDAIILKAYDLPPRIEKELLNLFYKQERQTPFVFSGYYPQGFTPCFTFSTYLQMKKTELTGNNLLKNVTPINSGEFHQFILDINER